MQSDEKRDRRLDVVVFGASGVTGEYVVEELASHHPGVKWGVAGRSVEKLRSVLRKVADITGKNLDDIEIMEADINNIASLTAMAQSTRLVMNVVGPYRFFGRDVVEQCVNCKTHYVDVCGEPQFLESVQTDFFSSARERGVQVVGCCGFDSIPCDMGVECLRKAFPGELDSVEAILSINRAPGNTVNYATWESAIHGLAHAGELKGLRRRLAEAVFPSRVPKPHFPLKDRSILFKSEAAGGWCVPFLGSDRSVITRTQMFNYNYKDQKPVQVKTYMRTRSLYTGLATLFFGAIFTLLARFVYGRMLLEKYPELFSGGYFSRTPPKRETMSDGNFEVFLFGRGWAAGGARDGPPDTTATALVRGPDPGYITTAICLVNAALVLLQEQDKVPFRGGVFTPASAFSDTTLMDRLAARGITVTHL